MLYPDKSLRGGCSGQRMSVRSVSPTPQVSITIYTYLTCMSQSCAALAIMHTVRVTELVSTLFFITTENEREKYFIPMWLCTNILYNFTIIWLLSKKSATIQTSSRHKERDKKRYISYSICDFFLWNHSICDLDDNTSLRLTRVKSELDYTKS